MATSRTVANRNGTIQPTFDIFTGASGSSPPLFQHQSFRESQVVKPDIGNEDLRARIKSLQYEVEAYKQDRDVTTIRHEQELRDAQAKAELDFRRAQASESSEHVTTHKHEVLQKELKTLQDDSVDRQHDLDKKLRTAHAENRSLREDLEEAHTELSSIDRQQKYQLQEVENKRAALQTTVKELRSDLESKTSLLQATEEKLLRREAEVEKLESEVIALKAVTGDGEELETIRRDLTEQVNHIRKLERTNREQSAKLRHLRQVHKAVEIVEEEKHVLENKVRMMDDMQRQLVEAQFQRQMLEDERKSWASYLQSTSSDGRPEFDSPEALARALAQERLDNASLTERLGVVQPEVSGKESIINSLELERRRLQSEIDKIKGAGDSDNNRGKVRLERQKALAVKEVEYLREQLRTFDGEDVTGEVPSDASKKIYKRVQDLETLVSQYRGELQTLHDELSKRDENYLGHDARPLKRPHDDESDERLGELSRKNRKLQSDFTSLQQKYALLTSELSATKSQFSALQQTSSTRILALRSNPTDDVQSLKYSTITSLREENRALLAQLEVAPHSTKVVPISSLENARVKIAELEYTVQEKEKRMLRLKQVFAKTTTDFREAVASLLGWKMDPMPQGRFRLTSLYNPTTMDDGEDGEGGSLIFDGVSGAMKASSPEFFLEIQGLIRFWVEERKWIPGFLAAATLEFWERTTKAQKI
ncbi:coiled-coil domain-containing protein mad1 [Xylographa parallela]|nr:coiled-coil domain-containing protein mad1 [Xylographa parallela]